MKLMSEDQKRAFLAEVNKINQLSSLVDEAGSFGKNLIHMAIESEDFAIDHFRHTMLVLACPTYGLPLHINRICMNAYRFIDANVIEVSVYNEARRCVFSLPIEHNVRGKSEGEIFRYLMESDMECVTVKTDGEAKIFLPPDWIKQYRKNPLVECLVTAHIAQQVADFSHGRFPSQIKVGDDCQRAACVMSEFHRFLEFNHIEVTLDEEIRGLIDHYPLGMQSIPRSQWYPLREALMGDFARLDRFRNKITKEETH